MAVVGIDTGRLDEVQFAVDAGLTAYNDGFLPLDRPRVPFAVSVRDEAGKLVGGLVGEFRLDWLYVADLWVTQSHRGKSYGAELLALAEREARATGKTHILLWTWSFQAPDFYRAQGYTEYARIPNHPKGHEVVHFVKWLED